MILIIVGALWTVPLNMEKRLGELDIKGKIETIKATGLLKSARILKSHGKSEETYCHLGENHQIITVTPNTPPNLFWRKRKCWKVLGPNLENNFFL